MLTWLLRHTEKFPHAEKFRMKQRVEDAAFQFHELLLRAVGGPANARRHLPEAEVRLNQLRLYLRLCMELKLLSFDQYEHVARLLTEIGKLLGAWLKKSASRTHFTFNLPRLETFSTHWSTRVAATTAKPAFVILG